MAELSPVPDATDDEPEQLGLFEGFPYTKRSLALGTAGRLTIDHDLAPGARVKFSGEGYVGTVAFTNKGTRRQVIVIETFDVES